MPDEKRPTPLLGAVQPQPETLADIRDFAANGWRCRCQPVPGGWYLCDLHEGYDKGVQRISTSTPRPPHAGNKGD